MTAPLIKVTTRSFSRHPVLRAELLAEFPGAVFNEQGARFGGAALVQYLDGADGAVVGLEPVTDEVLAALPNLRIVSKYGVGLDNIDEDACRARGVTVGWTGGVNALGVAEMTVCFLAGLSRNVLRSGTRLSAGEWEQSGGRHLSGRTVGIIGVGHVGKEVVRLLAPYGCRIMANDIVEQADYFAENGLIAASKEEIRAEADFVTIHTPLTPETRGMVDEAFLAAMKPSAYLVNTARGGIVDQAALKRALTEGAIAGAALDVFEEEPCGDLEFLSLPNLFSTPHIGGSAEESILAMGRSAIGHLSRYFNR